MTTQVISLSYKPRLKFLPFHQRTKRFSVLVAHRRCGKTYAALHDMIARALHVDTNKRPLPEYGFISPLLKQAKRNVWKELVKATNDIPGCKVSISELSVTLPNTATIRLYGADNPDAIRGSYFDGIIFDEFGDIPGSVYTSVVSPTLRDRKGWVVFMGTPKGKNNFYRQVQKALAQPDRYFYLCLKASETGHLTEEELAIDREDMDPEEYEREYECSFEASVKGSYYGTIMQRLEARNAPVDELQPVEWDPAEKVEAAFDLGRRDALAIWFWQTVDGEVRFIDYFEETGYTAEECAEMLQMKEYEITTMWLPHDALHETFATKNSVIDTFLEYGLPARKVPNPDAGNRVFHGVDMVRKALKRMPIRFDRVRCARGIEALKNYSRTWDADSGVFADTPKHDQWSHGADAFRYACAVINAETIQLSKERASARRAAELANAQRPASQRNDINIGSWTFQEAWKAHEERQAEKANDWSNRI